MSEKKKGRFSKAIVTYCLLVSTVVTAVVLWICLRSSYISAETVGVLCGLWGGELLLLCAKRLLADKVPSKKKSPTEGENKEESTI